MRLIPVIEHLKVSLAEHLAMLAEVEKNPDLAKNPDFSKRMFELDASMLQILEDYKVGKKFELPERFKEAGVTEWDGNETDYKVYKVAKENDNDIRISDQIGEMNMTINAESAISEMLGMADVAYFNGAIINGSLELFGVVNVERGKEW